jgi:tRNA (guanine-N7-)-methyltransferase
MERLLPTLRIQLACDPGVPLDPVSLFPFSPTDLWLEVGFGAGEHLAYQAKANPSIGMIGCEPFVNGIASLLSHLDEQHIENVRIFTDDARLLLSRLPEASVGRLFALFPDPWPKKRHHKRRLINVEIVQTLAHVLKDCAELRLATDQAEYARWILWHLNEHPAFTWMALGPDDWRARPLDWPVTRYEKKARARGSRPIYLWYRRNKRDSEI